jgi:hypothetical protein
MFSRARLNFGGDFLRFFKRSPKTKITRLQFNANWQIAGFH